MWLSLTAILPDGCLQVDYPALRRKCRGILLGRHLLAAMAERMWQFAVVLLLTVVSG
jgi:hypothetical protein